MATNQRYFQLSLRTLLEVVAIAAVVLVLIYQRPQPHSRFQVSSYAAMNENGPVRGCYVVDTQTGRVWHITDNLTPTKIAPLP